jgi:hypothetical protein
LVLLAKLKIPLIGLWYAHKVIEHGWSRAVLTHHLEIRCGTELRSASGVWTFLPKATWREVFNPNGVAPSSPGLARGTSAHPG